MAANISLENERVAGATVVRVAGEIDLSTGPGFARFLDAARANGERVIVDLRRVAFMDSAAVRILAKVRDAEAGSGRRLDLVVDEGAAAGLLDVTDADEGFVLYESVEAALADA